MFIIVLWLMLVTALHVALGSGAVRLLNNGENSLGQFFECKRLNCKQEC